MLSLFPWNLRYPCNSKSVKFLKQTTQMYINVDLAFLDSYIYDNDSITMFLRKEAT